MKLGKSVGWAGVLLMVIVVVVISVKNGARPRPTPEALAEYAQRQASIEKEAASELPPPAGVIAFLEILIGVAVGASFGGQSRKVAAAMAAMVGFMVCAIGYFASPLHTT
ncbi:MAG: hypothetical protein ABSB15_08890 [Bryobacteraceae bacterium]|jgi:hypothetical protein